MCVAGSGYSLMWFEGDQDFVRIDWQHGVVFPPADRQFHQHFTTSSVAARYLGTGFGNLRYPFTAARRRADSPAKTSSSPPVRRRVAIRLNTMIRTRASMRCGWRR